MKRMVLSIAAVFAGLLVYGSTVSGHGGKGGGHGGGHGMGHGGGHGTHGGGLGMSHGSHGVSHGSGHGNHGVSHGNHGSGHGSHGKSHGSGHSGGKGGKGMSTKPGKGTGSKGHHHHHGGSGYGGSGYGGSGYGGSGYGSSGYGGSEGVVSGYVEGQGYGPSAVAGAQGGTRQDRRYLRVKNGTSENLTVYVQYQTISKSKGWQWYPAAPSSDSRAVAFTFAPGQEANLRHEDWPVNANRVRVWARSASGEEFVEYRDEDLWLVEDLDGERAYYADEPETFTFTFSP